MPDRQRPRRRPPVARQSAVNVSFDGVRAGVARATLADVAEFVLRAEGVSRALASISLVTPRAMARLNREHLGQRGATDVIAFGLTAPQRSAMPLVADVYICPAVARVNARRFERPVREELARLVVHGMLHTAGWDHPEGENRTSSPMWVRQERLLAAWQRRASRARAGARA